MISLRSGLGWMLLFISGLAYCYLLGPLIVIGAASLGDTGYLTFPPQGFSLRWYHSAIADSRYINGFLVSVRLAVTVALISLVLGTTAAVGLTRFHFRGRATLEAIF